ncbi:30S ribosomal protein S18 [candidate division WOR-3 bacterium JGI_Cruoil_03_51_56]|uniref:Small ribosomal subunit protein bS18 n=1 Tax=candidate division WOR-3 bacterium JGI_Cruoil_03_51_56 TaxID=1973747 RepID=A0A235BTZ7_UNCW3|nr:MAG: 30S ribosomal protein S18 [candidate division WOR-3 bacterium JGI_Cruoil_03_51_56]
MKRTYSAPRRRRSFGPRRKRTCYFCDNKINYIDYKASYLRNFLTERGKIVPSKLSGVCTRHQRTLARAIKTARNMALLSFSS